MEDFEKKNRELYNSFLNYEAPFLEFLKTLKSFLESNDLDAWLTDEYDKHIAKDIVDDIGELIIDFENLIEHLENTEDNDNEEE